METRGWLLEPLGILVRPEGTSEDSVLLDSGAAGIVGVEAGRQVSLSGRVMLSVGGGVASFSFPLQHPSPRVPAAALPGLQI